MPYKIYVYINAYVYFKNDKKNMKMITTVDKKNTKQ